MTVSDSIRSVADLLDRLEDKGLTVTDIVGTEESLLKERTFRIGCTLRVPVLDGIADESRTEVTPIEASVRSDGTLSVDIDVLVDRTDPSPDAEPAADDGTATDTDTDTDTDTPAYKDPDKLRAAYEAHETFPAMRDALGVDVTAQTVRRHMIDLGIHEPVTNGNRTDDDEGAGDGDGDGEAAGDGDGEAAGDGDGEAAGHEIVDTDDPASGERETTIADGIDLPDDVTLDDVKDTVVDARTIHEVQERLGLERARARRLLTELDLIDLVSGRLADRSDLSVSRDEIDQRIREAAPPEA